VAHGTERMSRRDLLKYMALVGIGGPYALDWVVRRPQLARTAWSSPKAGAGPLRASGSRLVNAAGREVHLTGANWFGMEMEGFAPHGLWVRNWQDMLDQFVQAGFNTLRLPFSNQLLEASTYPSGIDFRINPDLQGLNGIQLLDTLIEGAGQRGLRVVLDRHRPHIDGQSALWYTDAVPEERWIADWQMLARRYRGVPAVIGADLHNEPHNPATWGDGNAGTDWRLAAERAGNAILAVNPDWLIIVEGIQQYGEVWACWGGNLAGARAHPVRLSHPEKLVYSPHDFGPSIAWQTWFSAPSFPANLPQVWQTRWGYLRLQDIAPVWVGEFGGRSMGQDVEGMWQRTLVVFLSTYHINYAYWAWNPDSGDTGGILQADWRTVDQTKLGILSVFQAPLLDHM
jgi:endoglucanase